jgi:hypothetical protein
MRRAGLLIGSLLVLALATEASAGENTSISPGKVDKGEKVTITAKNCKSGPGFKAFVRVSGLQEVPADADGTTVLEKKIRRRTTVTVTCIHKFDAGGEGVFYQESRTIKVRRN